MNFRTFYFDDIDLKQAYDWILISKNGCYMKDIQRYK